MSLVGRDSERAAIETLLQRARAGHGAALVLHGDPGVGKSVLLDAAVSSAADMQVLRTAGIASEAQLAHAGLHRLLMPLLTALAQLPEPQRGSLRVALGEAIADQPVDPLHIFLAVLRLFTDAAIEQPVLVVVDDAQWLDGSSAAALGFAARRLDGHRIALLCAAHAHSRAPLDLDDLPCMDVPGFSIDDASRLLHETTMRRVPVEVAAQLVAATQGNPLALRELGRSLTRAQLDGEEPLPPMLPVTETVERAFLARVGRLSRAAQELLLVVAADATAPLSAVLRAGQAQGSMGDAALGELEASGLAIVEKDQLRLEHPLVGAAVYAAASSLDRRRAHQALAASLTRDVDKARRTWHRAAAAIPPDSGIAADLDQTAHRSQIRGDHQTASLTWELASTFAERPGEAAEYLYQAAGAAWLTCQPERALELVEAGLAKVSFPSLRADLQELRARIHWVTGSVQFAHHILLDAASDIAAEDSTRARHLAMLAAALASLGGHSGTPIEAVRFADRNLDNGTPRDRCASHLLRGLEAVNAGRNELAVDELRAAQRVRVDLERSERDLLPSLGLAALHIGDYDVVEQHHRTLLLTARESGETIHLIKALTRLLLTDIAHSELQDLDEHAEEALSMVHGQHASVLTSTPQAARLWAAALRGADSYDQLLAEVQAQAPGPTAGILCLLRRDLIRWARALHEGPGSVAALHYLGQMCHPIMQRMAGIDRVEAAVRSGHPQLARLWTSDLSDFARLTGHEWAAAAAAHGEAVLGEPGTSGAHFERALQHHAASRRTFDRARTELAYGAWLRRNRHRREARDHLTAAATILEELGAKPWQQLAESELRAAGSAIHRDDAKRIDLTPQEREVTRLVSTGLSSKEIAQQLMLSRRTVDFHLRNIYTKTGVTSRVELALWCTRAG